MKGKRFALNAYIALLNKNPIKMSICFVPNDPLGSLFVFETDPLYSRRRVHLASD